MLIRRESLTPLDIQELRRALALFYCKLSVEFEYNGGRLDIKEIKPNDNASELLIILEERK